MIDELFKKKGELITSIELLQGQLRNLNEKILTQMEKRNASKTGEVCEEPKEAGLQRN